ncbi:hypothetical protein BC829DRAFT_431874 [Chytridium lagenaria]|nr:hypothetical protein BC829DRAFT_431874 [Chytridium lagenaria]
MDLSWQNMHEGDFQLVIPEVNMDNEDTMSIFEAVSFRIPTDAAVTAATTGETFSVPLADEAQALVEQLSKIRIRRLHLPKLPEVRITLEFTIKRLCSLIKQVVKRVPPVMKDQHSLSVINEPVIETIWDFFQTKTADISACPPAGSVDYQNLHKTLLMCLHEENAELRSEAARLVVEINGFWSLARWDNIAFRNTLTEMLRDGTSDESFMAGKTLCDMGHVDTKAIRRVQKGLGDLDPAKRAAAKDTLVSLAGQHCIAVLEGLISEAESTSWRVKGGCNSTSRADFEEAQFT